MTEGRFDRNERLFGKEGQARIRHGHLAVMGAGGLGSMVCMQAALLGFGKISVVDIEELSESNRNRYAGAWHSDPVPGSLKVDLAMRHINLIDTDIEVTAIHADIVSEAAFSAIKVADYVMGCVDEDGVRFFLNEASLAYGKTLIDLASDAPEPGRYGGRVSVVGKDTGCLCCREEIDMQDARRYLSSDGMRRNEAAAYGIPQGALGTAGPSVVSINGVIASLGVTALMNLATGTALPFTRQTFRGDLGTISKSAETGRPDCYYCRSVRGLGDDAGLGRFFRSAPIAG